MCQKRRYIMMKKDTRLSTAQAHQFWAEHLQAWHVSGLTQAQYCRQHDLNQKAFDYRKRKLKPPSPKTVFHPIRIRPEEDYDNRLSSLRLLVGHGYRIEVGDHFNPDTLHRLIKTLERS
jgi:hypothetical protein